jgi:hypothetical protein
MSSIDSASILDFFTRAGSARPAPAPGDALARRVAGERLGEGEDTGQELEGFRRRTADLHVENPTPRQVPLDEYILGNVDRFMGQGHPFRDWKGAGTEYELLTGDPRLWEQAGRGPDTPETRANRQRQLEAVHGPAVITPKEKETALLGAETLEFLARTGDTIYPGEKGHTEALGRELLTDKAAAELEHGGAHGDWAKQYLADVGAKRQEAQDQALSSMAAISGRPEDIARRVAELQARGMTDTAVGRVLKEAGYSPAKIDGVFLDRMRVQLDVLRDAGDYERAGALQGVYGNLLHFGGPVNPNQFGWRERLASDAADAAVAGAAPFERFSMLAANSIGGTGVAVERLAGLYPEEAPAIQRLAAALHRERPVESTVMSLGTSLLDPAFWILDLAGGAVLGKAIGGIRGVTGASRARYAARLMEAGTPAAVAEAAAARLTAQGVAEMRLANLARRFGLVNSAESAGRLLMQQARAGLAMAGVEGIESAGEGHGAGRVALDAVKGAGIGVGYGVVIGKALQLGGRALAGLAKAFNLDLSPAALKYTRSVVERGRAADLPPELVDRLRGQTASGLRVAQQWERQKGAPLTHEELAQAFEAAGVPMEAIEATIKGPQRESIDVPDIDTSGPAAAPGEADAAPVEIPPATEPKTYRQAEELEASHWTAAGAEDAEKGRAAFHWGAEDLSPEARRAYLQGFTGEEIKRGASPEQLDAIARSARGRPKRSGPPNPPRTRNMGEAEREHKVLRSATEGGPRLMTREDFKSQLRDAYRSGKGYSEDKLDAIMAVVDARARTWAHANRRPPADYYATRFARVVRGGKPGPEALYSIGAWHGSPHEFDRFSMDKIGTGEGAQAYGHGLYFAGHREVAEFYRNKLTTERNPAARFLLDGKPISRDTHGELRRALEFARADDSVDDVIRELRQEVVWRSKHPDALSPEIYARALAAIEKHRERLTTTRPGRTYKVELAPAEDELLAWDAPVHKQGPKVQAAIAKAMTGEKGPRWVPSAMGEGKSYVLKDPRASFNLAMIVKTDKPSPIEGWDVYDYSGGAAKFRAFAPTLEMAKAEGERLAAPRFSLDGITNGREFYQRLSSHLGGDEEASRALKRAGVRGIKYLDAGSRAHGVTPAKLEAWYRGSMRNTTLRMMFEDRVAEHAHGTPTMGEYAQELVNVFDGFRTEWFTKEEISRLVSTVEPPPRAQGTHNYVVFDDADVKITDLYQRRNGRAAAAVEFLEDGRALVRALEQPDLASFLHEIGHVFRRDLDPGDLRTLTRWLGEGGVVTRAGEEKFARAFELYLRDGRAPTAALQGVFNRLRLWLSQIYRSARELFVGRHLPDDIRDVFDRLLARDVDSPPIDTAPPAPPAALNSRQRRKLQRAQAGEPMSTEEPPRAEDPEPIPGGPPEDPAPAAVGGAEAPEGPGAGLEPAPALTPAAPGPEPLTYRQGWARIAPTEAQKRDHMGTIAAKHVHRSGWVITHSGHPTAIHPYMATDPQGQAWVSPNGRGFDTVQLAKAGVEAEIERPGQLRRLESGKASLPPEPASPPPTEAPAPSAGVPNLGAKIKDLPDGVRQTWRQFRGSVGALSNRPEFAALRPLVTGDGPPPPELAALWWSGKGALESLQAWSLQRAGAEAAAAPVKVAEPLNQTGPKGRSPKLATPPSEVPPPKVKPVRGRPVDLELPDGRALEGWYQVVSADDLIPSHDARRGFEPNPLGDKNERDYRDPSEGKPYRATVQSIAKELKPAFLLADTPTAVDGPPIVSPDRVVLGGNARTQALQLAYSHAGDPGGYRSALIEAAERFGLDRAQVEAIKDPVLVRSLVWEDVGAPGELSRILNKGFTTAKTALTDAASRASKLDARAIDQIVSAVGEGSLADALNDPRETQRVISALVEVGAYDAGDFISQMDERGLLSKSGRDTIEQTLLAAAVGNLRTLAETAPATRQTLLMALSPMTRLRRAAGHEKVGLDFPATLNRALEALAEYRKSGSASIAHLVEQASMFAQPWREDPRAIALAHALLEESPTRFRGKLRELAEVADEAIAGQATLMSGKPADVGERFAELFPAPEAAPRAIGGFFNMGTGSGGLSAGGLYEAKGLNASSPYPEGNMGTPAAAPVQLQRELLRGVPMPELVKLATELMAGKVPGIKPLRTARGVFYPMGGGYIKIDPATAADPEGLAKTLAHEIGHLIDYLDDRTMKRGNLLGRALVLKNFMKGTFGEGGPSNKELRAELIALTKWWRPIPAGADKKYVEYRLSGVELYADALSVLLNSPGELGARAPKFWKAFTEHLDRKPDVREAYLGIQDLLAGDDAAIAAARRADIREAFGKGEEIMRARTAEKRSAGQSIVEAAMQAFIDTGYPIIRRERAVQRRGIPVPMEQSAKHALEELALKDNAGHVFLSRVQRRSVEPYLEAGGSMEDLGEYMLLRRIATGDRQAMGNPFGHTPETAAKQLVDLKRSMGAARYEALERAVGAFQDELWTHVENAVELGTYNRETFETAIEPNRGNYATFAVLDHLDDSIPAGIRQQVGTFKPVANPFVSTVLKTISLVRLNELQKAKREVLGFIGQHYPEEYKAHKWFPGQTEPRPEPGRAHVLLLDNGRVTYHEVDEYVAKVFQRSDIGVLARVAKLLDPVTYKIFHPLYVTWSLGWNVMNVIRDVKRTHLGLTAAEKEGMTLGQAVRSTLTDVGDVLSKYTSRPTLKAAWDRARGIHNEKIEAMLNDRALGIPFARTEGPDDLTAFERQLHRYGLGTPEQARPKLLEWAGQLLEGVEALSTFTETLPKVAAWDILTERGITGRRRAYTVRNYVGTPNTARKGQATFLTNRLFMYSNVLLQGLRADAELAVRPSTRSGFLTRMALVDLAPKVIQKAAALGLMGAGVKAVFDLIPDYDLAKFVIIPLGIRRDDAGNAKAVYLRIPHQDTARILAAATWHLLDGHFQKGGAALVGELPHLSPPLAMASKWLTYVQGQNPLDDYRNRPIIGRDAWEAGGWNATHDMVQWTADQFGQASAVASWLTGFPDQNQSLNTAERLITQLPGISAILRTSDRGLSEKQWEAVQLDEQEAARFRLGLPDEARSLVRERYRLKRIGVDALTPAQRARLMPVEGFYRSSYVPLTRLMKDAQARGDTKRVEQLRGMLQAAARRAGASR